MVQLVEHRNKYTLRQYQGSNRVNALSFGPSPSVFASCANDTCVRIYDMQDNQGKAQLEITAAHADNIKQLKWLGEQLIVTGSADRAVKLWDLRQTANPLSTTKLEHSVEDFCLIDDQRICVA